MIPLSALDCVDRLLRDLCDPDRRFGGKILLLGGDFRQILPVLPNAEPAEVVANTILNHYTMKDGSFLRDSLTENMRLHRNVRDGEKHREWLLALGEGALEGGLEDFPLSMPLPVELCMDRDAPVEDLIDWAYPEVAVKARDALQPGDTSLADSWFRERAILTPRNDEARHINAAVLDRLDSTTEFTSTSHDTIKDPEGEDAISFPEEFLHTLQPSGFPPHLLTLRSGAVVILLRNLYV